MTISALLTWLITGLVVGGLAHLLVPGRNRVGIILTILVGIVGAIVGGLVFSLFGATGVTGFNIYSLIVAVIGSVVVLWLYHMFESRRAV